MKKIALYLQFLLLASSGFDLYSKLPESKKMTQSEAHISVPLINKMVQRWYSFKKTPYFKQLYDAVTTKEREFNDSHYAFYNAFSNEWRVPQDLYLKLYERFHPLTMDINDFRAFRWIPVDHKTPTELIKEEMVNHGLVNDNEWRLKTYLLSTNLALFGNTGYPGECTFDYYLKAKSNTKVSEQIFKGILDIFDDPTKYVEGETPALYRYLPEIMNLDQYLAAKPLPDGSEPQSLAQIFIPKSIVDKVAYIAWVQGIPYDAQLANWVMSTVKKSEGTAPLYPPTKALLENIRELFKDQQENHPLFKSILNGIEEGKCQISTFLDQYKEAPYLIPGLNNIQARLIVSPEFIGSIGTDVKVFTYDKIPADKKKAYEDKLNKIVDKIFTAKIARAKAQTLALENPAADAETVSTDEQALVDDSSTDTTTTNIVQTTTKPKQPGANKNAARTKKQPVKKAQQQKKRKVAAKKQPKKVVQKKPLIKTAPTRKKSQDSQK